MNTCLCNMTSYKMIPSFAFAVAVQREASRFPSEFVKLSPPPLGGSLFFYQSQVCRCHLGVSLKPSQDSQFVPKTKLGFFLVVTKTQLSQKEGSPFWDRSAHFARHPASCAKASSRAFRSLAALRRFRWKSRGFGSHCLPWSLMAKCHH